jgi:hypothetical protein
MDHPRGLIARVRMLVPMKYASMTLTDLERALRRRGVIVFFRPKKAAIDRMPTRPANVRFPGKKVPIDIAMVMDVRGDVVRIEDDHGFGAWVAIDDGLYAIDEL